ncbi:MULTISPECIES: DUF6522 family protein [Paracoccus]|uniref:DUF6522 family protein n=1 Tax=Paracoccus TaxID=265 RepID=UPI000CEC7502|nr:MULTISPECIES: DUF6522 family protein [Paracoccus]MDK8875179.1 DUF6522 family protein [Paracoccus sp. SSJ]UFS66695.1 DUF6522 family protein [Paracoccus denitrificans]
MDMNRIDLTEQGFVVEAQELASAFGLEPGRVPGLLRENRITTRCETGEGEDAGRHRLTFFFQGQALRLTVDATGTILKRARFDVPTRSSA